jgi:hypothetical protein
MRKVKRSILSIGASLLFAAVLSLAAQQTWTGEISDSMCGASHQAMAKPGMKVNPRDCTLQCVKAGNKYVFCQQGSGVRDCQSRPSGPGEARRAQGAIDR